MMRILGGEVVGECTVYYWYRTALADNLDDITADAVGKYEILAAWRLVCAKRLLTTGIVRLSPTTSTTLPLMPLGSMKFLVPGDWFVPSALQTRSRLIVSQSFGSVPVTFNPMPAKM